MTIEESMIKFSDILDIEGVLKVKGIHEENHTPHPFTVGPRHVKHAADKHGGMMGEATLQKIPCAHPKCQLTYDEHESEKVLFLQLTADTQELTAHAELLKIKDTLKELEIGGVAFVDSEEGWKFLKG